MRSSDVFASTDVRPHVFSASTDDRPHVFANTDVRKQNANPNAKPTANADQKCQTDAWIRR